MVIKWIKKTLELVDIKYISDIYQDSALLKISPSVWSKIYRKELIFDNGICFPPYKLGEDLSFVLQTFLKAKGIVFLNNFLTCNYLVRVSEDNQSITRNVDFKLLEDGMDNLIFCSKLDGFSDDIKVFPLVSNILFWFSSWKQSNLNHDENKCLIKKLYVLKELSNNNLRIKLLLSFIINFIKFSGFNAGK